MNVETNIPDKNGPYDACNRVSESDSHVDVHASDERGDPSSEARCLTDQGTLDPALLYEPPFTDIAPMRPDRLFDEHKVARLFTRIKEINESAAA